MPKKIKIDLIMDVICPWCYLGHAHLKKAMAERAGEYPFEVSFKPFLLYPHIPETGIAKQDFKTHRRPGMGRLLLQEAESVGLEIDYKKIDLIPNSLEAHRFLYLLPDYEEQLAFGERIFEAYFSLGQDVGDKEVLLDLALESGINTHSIGKFHTTTEGAQEVEELIQQYREEGISAVPGFRFNDEHLIQGVQQSSAFIRYFDRLQK
ncbi:MAG: DsbA family oxidoreductase [Bacteroidia bacterium]|nr:DsbA family oxidoreductase [Bacteroidia bacterium]